MESSIPKSEGHLLSHNIITNTNNQDTSSSDSDVSRSIPTKLSDNTNLVGKEVKVTEVTTKKVRKQRNKKSKRLTDHQVRINHVTSEKKRREMIRSIYDDLVGLVPGLKTTENRSELIIYLKTMAYLKWLYSKNKRLREKIKTYGTTLEQELIDKNLVWELDDNFDLLSSPQE